MRYLAGLLLFASVLAFPQDIQTSPSDPILDSALFVRTIALLGWTNGHARGGVIAQGNLTRVDDEGIEFDPTTLTLEMRADHRFRMELGSGDVTIVSDALASIKSSGSAGSRGVLPHVAVSLVAPYFPFLTDIAATNDPDVQIARASTTAINGEEAVGIAIRRSFPAAAQFRAARESSSAITLWISQKSGLPIRADFVRLATDNWNLPIPYSVYYTNWQLINGVLVPLQIDEGTDSKTFLRYRFTSVAFNSKIPDSDFVTSLVGGAN